PGCQDQRARRAAPGRTEQNDELPLANVEVDPLHGSRAVGVRLLEALDAEKAHAPRSSGNRCPVTISRTVLASVRKNPHSSPPSHQGWSMSTVPNAMPWRRTPSASATASLL